MLTSSKDITNCQCLHGTPVIDANGNCQCQDSASFPQTTGRQILDTILATPPTVSNTGAQGIKIQRAINSTNGVTNFLKAHPIIVSAAIVGIIYYFFFQNKSQVKAKETSTRISYA